MEIMENRFWKTSWENVDSARISSYIDSFDLGEDSLISFLRQNKFKTVCDAGCGCGIYSLKLAANGFSVSGFDLSEGAIKLARALIEERGCRAELKTANVIDTDYPDCRFDCVVSRDVLDHMKISEATKAVKELLRITKPSGIVWLTLDGSDEEYEAEPHIVNADGDYIYTDGKWNGMVFHPYDPSSALWLIPSETSGRVIEQDGSITLIINKSFQSA